MTESSSPPASPPERHVLRALLGLLLVLPAAVACGLTLLAPSLTMVGMSFERVSALHPRDSIPVGLANYTQLGRLLAGSGAVSMTLLVTGVRLAALLVIPALLALGISRALPALRLGARLLLTVPAALFAPALALIAWVSGLRPDPSPAGVRASLLLAEAVISLTVGCAVLTPIYLAAMSAPPAGTSARPIPWRPLAVIWLVSLLAVIALTPQGLVTSLVTQGGPLHITENMMLLIYRQAFVNFQFGVASALSTVLLAQVMPIGLFAGALLVWSGVGLHTTASPQPAPDPAARTRLVLIGLLTLAPALACAGLAGLPYLLPSQPAGAGELPGQVNLASTLALTILPPLVGIFLVQLPLTYLAALGIGALRPFGRYSELLLLPFAPWLFVTVGPLLVSLFIAARMAGSLNTPVALLPRFAVSIPILFVLTLFFKGQGARRRAHGGSILRGLILPSLPLALLLGFAATLIAAQGLTWPLIAASSSNLATLPVLALEVAGQLTGSRAALMSVILPAEGLILIAWLLIFALFQLFYLPRLALARVEPAPAAAPIPSSQPAAPSSPPVTAASAEPPPADENLVADC